MAAADRDINRLVDVPYVNADNEYSNIRYKV